MIDFEHIHWNPGDCPADSKPSFYLDIAGWRQLASEEAPDATAKQIWDSWAANIGKEYDITFVKKDGSERTLQVTGVIPDDKAPKGDKHYKENTDILRVFVEDIQEWRSVRYDSILTVRSR